ncbi:MAG: methylmalonyl Co-A mutase-associated GTPase MeaB [Deltaproteobacteria bacterium]|nr:MAG: methylmalonyl Co-A mutase-associated GTPase MeaB [Deltaproteobacteria bacterium]
MPSELARQVLDGSPRALARVITWVENDDPRAVECLEILYPHMGRAHILGLTGSPGAGKSSLTDQLTHHFRNAGKTVGIVAVDPSSPFTGGALLGDRIRMSRHAGDPGVFIRSMATRGFLGGLAQTTDNVVKAMDAAGRDVVIVETVGVGQDEIDIMRIADTICLILAPGYGDIIQSMKAGVMEIADIYVINKSDHAGADQLYTEVNSRILQDSQIRKRDREPPPVVKTVATEKRGIDDLMAAIESCRCRLKESGALLEKRRERIRQQTFQMIQFALFQLLERELAQNGRLDRLVDAIIEKKENPYQAMREIVDEFIKVPAG